MRQPIRVRPQQVIDALGGIAFIAACVVTIHVVTRGPATAVAQAGAPSTGVAASPVEALTVTLGEHASIGEVNAPLTLVEFTDFQCPFCARFANDTLPALEREFVDSGQLRVVVRHLPLGNHAYAPRAAQAAACADSLGAFRGMHNALFRLGGRLDDDSILSSASLLDLPMERFRACFDETELPSIGLDMAEAARLQVEGTPTFFLGRLSEPGQLEVLARLRGAQPIEVFRAAIADAMQALKESSEVSK